MPSLWFRGSLAPLVRPVNVARVLNALFPTQSVISLSAQYSLVLLSHSCSSWFLYSLWPSAEVFTAKITSPLFVPGIAALRSVQCSLLVSLALLTTAVVGRAGCLLYHDILPRVQPATVLRRLVPLCWR
jgi:hypothetical protein